ncbi:ELM1/GtrOC1 family putative glycosyltransferase [Nitrococcus mobilis]|uniref:Predicted nucleoside-diphosphate-sugar epimerase n=1 Tax=Nitrococcus mobilis Nb-231 TaxID=314278 RepID=A4BPR1_9GAMM|nr:ELM1/GtrOC1 family putative glycosyltransferase [Nitrococcus mobilis]EAR22066.1 Predicted nucleoside-diphosphate-sugar epimerase [Nitrococcus mobilis Nb-231]
MAFLIKRVFAGLAQKDPARSRKRWPELECVVLPAEPGTGESHKPPVRIFLGTEGAQFRAERVFVWSIAKVRDPARRYEIYLLKDLPGFDRRWWLTGFTAYRFAIPELAGGVGRAIYNDTDQIYLADPAELFDTPMQGHGFLSIQPRDTSVMLIDCARMVRVWTLARARWRRRKQLEAKALAVSGTWGRLDGAWNARDSEYTPGRSRLVHFTTLQTQPWLPFPDDYVYWHNPVGALWSELERSADQAGYQLFDASTPSAGYRALQAHFRRLTAAVADSSSTAVDAGFSDWPAVQRLLQQSHARTILEFGFVSGCTALSDERVQRAADWVVERSEPDYPPWEKGGAAQSFDAVLCRRALEYFPDEDLPWLIEQLFALSDRLLHVEVDDAAVLKRLPDGSTLEIAPRRPARWFSCFEQASRRHPGVHYHLVLNTRDGAGRRTQATRVGGRLVGGAPRVWVLAHRKPGHTTQAVGLAEALAWPYEIKLLQTLPWALLWQWIVQRLGWPAWSPRPGRGGELRPPWPDVVIAAGWFPTRVARWLRCENPALRAVLLGRKNGPSGPSDLLIGCVHFGLPLAANRIETLLPVHPVSRERLRGALERRAERFAGLPRPRVVALVGGDSKHSILDTALAYRLGKDLQAFAQGAGGVALAVTSRRTGTRASAALKLGIGGAEYVHEWRRDEADNPYFAYLGAADVLVVTGDSESMLAEAAATDKPLYIYPIAERVRLWDRFARWVTRQAQAQPRNKRGSVRPQRGLQYLCARLIDRAWVLPARDTAALYQALLERGVAQMFGAPLELRSRVPFRESAELAARVRERLGFYDHDDASRTPEKPRPVRPADRNCAVEGRTESVS